MVAGGNTLKPLGSRSQKMVQGFLVQAWPTDSVMSAVNKADVPSALENIRYWVKSGYAFEIGQRCIWPMPLKNSTFRLGGPLSLWIATGAAIVDRDSEGSACVAKRRPRLSSVGLVARSI